MTSPESVPRAAPQRAPRSAPPSAPTGESSTTSTGPVARLFLLLIAGYRRFVSPLLGPRCRFYPSCSQYAATAIRVHGAGRGLVLAVRRLLRCHPWNPGGVDHVPPPVPSRAARKGADRDTSASYAGVKPGVNQCHTY